LGKKRTRKRQRRLDTAVATIQQRFGPRALFQGAPAKASAGPAAVPVIPTGFPALDLVLGTGGLPRGKICELVGPATSGKTTLALKFLAQAQAGGGQVVYIDQALYFDPDYAYRCGLDLSRLLVGTTHDLQEALAMTEALARSGGPAAMVFDALEFLWTDAAAAALLAATLNRLPGFLARTGLALLVLHESPPDDAPGGGSPALSALAHAASIRLHVARERWLRRHDDVRGYEARVEVLKNRLGPAGRSAHIEIEFNGTVRGIDL
jgi:recombination protein RecA